MTVPAGQDKRDNIETQVAPLPLPLADLRVLLVEDEPDLSFLFLLILEEAGAKVCCAATASTVTRLIDEYQPHLLICDLRLPDVDGLQLMRLLRGQGISTETLPAIAVSSYSREFNEHWVLSAGFQVYLHKPCDPDQLVATAHSLAYS